MPDGTELPVMKKSQKPKITLYWYVGRNLRTYISLESTFLLNILETYHP